VKEFARFVWAFSGQAMQLVNFSGHLRKFIRKIHPLLFRILGHLVTVVGYLVRTFGWLTRILGYLVRILGNFRILCYMV
jgi:hypothetical protein